jgi:predicted esterase
MVRVDGANRFFMLHAENTYDEGEVIHAASELSDFVWNAAAEYGFDTNNVYAVGFSNGANAAHSMLMLQPESLAGAIAFGTNRVFENRSVFKRLPELGGKRVWIANGSVDPYSPTDRVEALVADLTKFGASVEYSLHSGGHTISHEQVRRIAQQLAN